MIPKSLSASSLQTAETCLARWKAENYDKVPSYGGNAAMVGTSVHGALEMFVKKVFLEKVASWDDRKLLLDLYKIAYMETFNTADTQTDEFEDGLELVIKWHERTVMKDTVVSCEVKENFPIKTSVGDIPFNYIWDRADQISETEYRVVDYKTIRIPVTPEQLKKKIQPRAYALAAQIKWPHATRIWVTYDLLRHDPVGAVFTRDDNAIFWRYLKAAAERIIATPEDNVPETLNPECKFCVRKAVCETLDASIAGGFVIGMTPEVAARRKMRIASQMKALEALDAELDEILVKEAEARDEFTWDIDGVRVEITASRRRDINSNAVARIVGPEVTAKYGKFRLSDVDKLLKGQEITFEQKKEIKSLIGYKWGEPSAKVTPTSPLEEES